MIKEEEEKKQQRLGAVPPKPALSKKPSPPPPSPKPSRAALQKPAASPKPVPSPKPDLRKKMHLPVPPAKPKTESPAFSRGSTPQLPRTQQSATPPPPPSQFSQPPKPSLPQQTPVDSTFNKPPPIFPDVPVESSKEFTPNKAGFADAQAQLARSLNGTIKRGSVKQNSKPNSPATTKSAVPSPAQAYPPTSPPVNHLPDPVDDLPPPPPEILDEEQQVPKVSAQHSDRPDINATPSRSKIAAMVKNLNAPPKPAEKPIPESQTSESSGRNNVSELTTMLNRTLKKSQTTSGLTNHNSTPQKPNNKPNMSNMSRSLTCPQMDIVSQPKPATPSQKPGPVSSVQDRAAELAKVMSGKAPPKQSPVLPAQSPFANQPPLPPPKQFSSGAPPPPRAFSQNNTQPPSFQPSSAPPQARQPPSSSRPSQPPPQPPGPMRAPPPAIPPAVNYTTPALPSRKDSLMASRNRTTSGSSGGSHGSSARAGSVASHASSQDPPGVVRPPPRTISRDNLRASSRNGHRGSRENLTMNTATTVNTSSEHGIPDIFQRGGIPGGHPGMPGRDNSPQPPPRQDHPGHRPPSHPLHFPPQRFNNPAPAGRGRDSPARVWHDTLMRDSSPIG